MKKESTFLLAVLLAAGTAVAQQRTNTTATTSASHTNASSASANLTALKPAFHWLGPAAPVSARGTPRYIEGLDTRAWTTVVEMDRRKRAFPDGETHEAGLTLLWWGSEPRSK